MLNAYEKRRRRGVGIPMTISHAAADGFHVARFLNEVEEAGRALAGSMGGARL